MFFLQHCVLCIPILCISYIFGEWGRQLWLLFYKPTDSKQLYSDTMEWSVHHSIILAIEVDAEAGGILGCPSGEGGKYKRAEVGVHEYLMR